MEILQANKNELIEFAIFEAMVIHLFENHSHLVLYWELFSFRLLTINLK